MLIWLVSAGTLVFAVGGGALLLSAIIDRLSQCIDLHIALWCICRGTPTRTALARRLSRCVTSAAATPDEIAASLSLHEPEIFARWWICEDDWLGWLINAPPLIGIGLTALSLLTPVVTIEPTVIGIAICVPLTLVAVGMRKFSLRTRLIWAIRRVAKS